MDYNTISQKIDESQIQTEKMAQDFLLCVFRWGILIFAMIIGITIAVSKTVICHAYAFLRISVALAYSINTKKRQQAQEDEWEDEDNPCNVSFQQRMAAGR